MKNSILTVAIALSLVAQVAPAQGKQRPGMQFLRLGVGARAEGLGQAYTAKVDDASATYWNPSALPRIASAQVLFYRDQSFSDFSYNYAAFTRPIRSRKMGFGFAFGHMGKGTFDGRDEAGKPTGEFTASDSLLSFSLGKQIGQRWSIGGTGKYMLSKIESRQASGFAFDLAASAQMGRKTRIALGAYHLGPQMKFMNEAIDLPATVSAGLERQLLKAFSLSADLRYDVHSSAVNAAMGGEMKVGAISALRIGYRPQLTQSQFGRNSASNEPLAQLNGLGMGFGIRLVRFNMDYAFVPMGELGIAHHLSFVLKFGQPKKDSDHE